MDISKKMYCVSQKSTRCEDTVEHSLESDITLPEYFPDIVSVLRSTLTPNVSQTKLASGKLQIEGTALISILYLCEENKLHCFEQRIPISKTVDIANCDDCYAVCSLKTQYVNCRVSSQRKLSVHSSVSISYKLFFKNSKQIICDCEEASIQMKKEKISAVNLKDSQVKSFVINETLELGSAQNSIGQIVRSEAVALVDSVKMVAGKALIKGQLKVKVTYLTEKNCLIEKIESTMPISQIVEIDADDDCTDYVCLKVGSIDVFAKTDSSGALRMFDLSVCLFAEIDIFEEKEYECVTDAYSTLYELPAKYEKVKFSNISERFSEPYLFRGVLETGEEKIKNVSDLNCRDFTFNAQINNNELLVSGMLAMSVILVKENDEIISVDKELEFEYSCRINASSNDSIYKIDAALSSLNYTINDEHNIDIRAEIDFSAVVIKNYEKTVIVDVSVDNQKSKERNNASLTIYFSEAGEEIWSIAKRYNTTVKAITQENNLSDDIVKERKKLLIPCK